MEETIIQEGKEQLSNALGVVASSLNEAMTQYGPQAVDLAFMVYRVDAAQQLVQAAAVVAFFIALIVLFFKKWVPHTNTFKCPADTAFAKYSVGVGLGMLSLTFGAVFASDFLYIPYWLALFGYPEVYMATKALVAAGMM